MNKKVIQKLEEKKAKLESIASWATQCYYNTVRDYIYKAITDIEILINHFKKNSK